MTDRTTSQKRELLVLVVLCFCMGYLVAIGYSEGDEDESTP